MKIKTYITLWFSSEGDDPTRIVDDLQSIGFVPISGNYDMVFVWERRPKTEDLIKLADAVKKTLTGRKVLFKLETV